MTAIQVRMDNWVVLHLTTLKTAMRVIFGAVWGIDGVFKFQPGLAGSIVSSINSLAQSQPGWLTSWFSFWSQAIGTNPALFVYSTGFIELFLSFSLIFGFLRKISYTIGFLLSLVIWSVPEGFGGALGPGSTDIGTGIIYAFVFLFLLIINAAFGPSKFSLDGVIEKKFPGWKRVAEIRGQ
jgi:nitrite reductase (NO-forming)